MVASSQNSVSALGIISEKDQSNKSGMFNLRQPQWNIVPKAQNPIGGVVAQDKGETTSQRQGKVNLNAAAKITPTEGTPLSRMQTLLMLRRHPGEAIFFKLLHVEVSKATHFFEETKRELQVEEALIQEHRSGLMERKQHAGEGRRQTDQEQQEVSVHRDRIRLFHLNVLRLETFAIMTYIGISKILKKHDRATGFSTQKAFMDKVVSPSSFASYPWLLAMVERCQRWMLECCNLLDIGKRIHHQRTARVAETDEARLFLDMIERINGHRKRTQEELIEHSEDSSCADFNDEDDTKGGNKHHGGAGEACLPLKKRQRNLP
jgi:hypothetical protein